MIRRRPPNPEPRPEPRSLMRILAPSEVAAARRLAAQREREIAVTVLRRADRMEQES